MKFLKLTTCMLAILSLGACFGSDGEKVTKAAVDDPVIVLDDPADDEEEEEEEPVEIAATYSEKEATKDAMDGALDAHLNFTFTMDDNDLPESGSASYAGVMELPDPHIDDSLLGDLVMGIDFASLGVTGTADNFSNSLDEVWSGSLDITGGFATDVFVDGELTNVHTGVTVIEAELDDDEMYSSDDDEIPEYIVGVLDGTATTDDVEVDLDETNTSYIAQLTD